MGRYVFKLPDVGEGIAEAEIVAWHVKPGEAIARGRPARRRDDRQGDGGDALAGRRHRRRAQRRARRQAPGRLGLVVLEVAGEGNVAAAAAPAARAPQPLTPALSLQAGRGREAPPARSSLPSPRERGEGQGEGPAAPPVARRLGAKPLASPAVRRRAWDLGIELQFVPAAAPAAASPADLDAYVAAGGGARPGARRWRGATGSRRCRSSACAARSPSACRNPSGASRISPMSRRSTSPSWRRCAAI